MAGGSLPADAADKAPHAAQVNPCNLITQAEATAAMGEPVGPGRCIDGEPYRFCTFTTAGNTARTVTLSLFSIDKETFDAVDDQQMPVRDLGLDAFIAKNNSILSVYHHDYQLQIHVSYTNPRQRPQSESAEEKLAVIAVTRF